MKRKFIFFTYQKFGATRLHRKYFLDSIISTLKELKRVSEFGICNALVINPNVPDREKIKISLIIGSYRRKYDIKDPFLFEMSNIKIRKQFLEDYYLNKLPI